MKLTLLGPPGAGKGTQARLLEREFGWPHISTGEIFRGEISRGTALGREADALMKEGKLVPDEVVVAIVARRLSLPDVKTGYILDGYPRTIPQAEALEKTALGPDWAVQLVVDKAQLVARIAGRLTCSNCGAMFHSRLKPPQAEGVCDLCHSALAVRADDNETTVLQRYEVYKWDTEPLLGFYRSRDRLMELDAGVLSPMEIYAQLKEMLMMTGRGKDG